jgi:hypothetical protein
MKLKNIKKQNTMKTRILTLTGIFLFTIATFAGANNHRVINKSAASCHENAITNSLESWVISRDNWEQEGQAETLTGSFESSSMLNEWIAARDNWEQEGEGMVTASTDEKKISLDEWVAARESWEQTGEKPEVMEEWIAGLTEWEQK